MSVSASWNASLNQPQKQLVDGQHCCWRRQSWVSWSVASVNLCVSVCLSACPRSKKKTDWAINIKLGRHTVHGSHSVYVDPENKKVKCQGHATKSVEGCACRLDCSGFLVVYSRFSRQVKWKCKGLYFFFAFSLVFFMVAWMLLMTFVV